MLTNIKFTYYAIKLLKMKFFVFSLKTKDSLKIYAFIRYNRYMY